MSRQRGDLVPVKSASVEWREFGRDAMLLDVTSGEYVQIDEIGVSIWKSIDGRRTARDIVTAIAAEFDETPETVEHDILEFIDQLSERRLLVSGA